MQDKHEASHLEDGSNGSNGGANGLANGVPVKFSKKQKAVRHCARFWWIYFIGFLCSVVLVTCLIIFVGVPALAQKKVKEVKIDVQSIVISNTKTDSYDLAMNSTLKAPSSVKATVYPFLGAMFLKDLEPHTPFVHIEFPRTTSSKHQEVNISGPIQIENMDAFTNFNKWVLNNATTRVGVKGKTHVKVSGISKHYPITFENTITLNGVENFNGLNVSNISISLLPDARGDNMKGHVSIPNRSVFTLELGNVSFNTFLDNKNVGTTYIDNLVLYPGINNVDMRANIDQVPVLAALGTQPACRTGILPFVLSGKSVINNGQPLPYFADALAAGSVKSDINVGAALRQGLNVSIPCL